MTHQIQIEHVKESLSNGIQIDLAGSFGKKDNKKLVLEVRAGKIYYCVEVKKKKVFGSICVDNAVRYYNSITGTEDDQTVKR